MERAIGKIVKLESFNLERSYQLNDLPWALRVVGKRSCKEREVGKILVGKNSVGKTRTKLERFTFSWKDFFKLERFFMLERFF